MMRAIIIDDEITGVNTLKILIEKHCPEVRIVSTATDPEKGIELIEDYKPEIVFLDVSMPQMTGFELLERLAFKDFRLVFTTAHAEYAIKAIKSRADDYLLKPIDIDELKDCVRHLVLDQPPPPVAESKENIIELPVRDGIIFIRPRDVIRMEAQGSYTMIYLDEKVKYIASKNLKECESMFNVSYLYRCHQSHIVNLHKVIKMVSADGLFAKMTDGSMPEIGRKNKDLFLEKLKGI
jgi:two-component system, LytTR family, response regulator